MNELNEWLDYIEHQLKQKYKIEVIRREHDEFNFNRSRMIIHLYMVGNCFSFRTKYLRNILYHQICTQNIKT